MGACQSAPVESTVSDSGNKKVHEVTGKNKPSSQEAAPKSTSPNNNDVTNNGNKKVAQASQSSTSGRGGGDGGGGQVPTNGGGRHHPHHHRNIDVTEKTSNDISDSPGRSSSDDDSVDGNNNNNGENDYEVNIQMEFEVLPLKKSGGSNSRLHKRQSSCSSYDSWGGNSNSALSELKNELSSDDGLCTRVVRIEVRHYMYYGFHEALVCCLVSQCILTE